MYFLQGQYCFIHLPLRSLRLCEKSDVKPTASAGLPTKRKHAVTVRLSQNQYTLVVLLCCCVVVLFAFFALFVDNYFL